MPPVLSCACGRPLPARRGSGRPRKRCDQCAPPKTRTNAYAVRCAGTCGRLLNGSSSSLPAGKRMCQPCRQAARSPRASAAPRDPIGCANPRCQATIERPRARQKFCSRQCGQRVHDAQPNARARWIRKNAKRRPDPRAGASWDRLRAQVLAEEPDCWVCGDPIDLDLRWPHAMCGTADHVVPLEAGGALLDRDNVRAAHRECNQRRHVEWRRAQRAAQRSYDDLRGAYDQRGRVLERVRELHAATGAGFCRVCVSVWPCATVEALDEAPS